MRIALVITGLGVGGAERLVTQMADQYVERGHEVMLVYLVGEAKLLPERSEVHLHGLHLEKSVTARFLGLWKLRQILKKFRPDVVHSHMVHANLAARLLRLTLRIPRLVCSAHSTNEGGIWRMWGYRLTDNLADVTSNVSADARNAFIRKKAAPAEKIIVVYNGINTDKFVFQPLARRELRERLKLGESKALLAVGRFFEPKDYPNLLGAFQSVRVNQQGCRLLIVGDGPLRPWMENFIRENELEGCVHLLGVRSDVEAWMSACDVFVLSSAWEGFGLVVAEAMACERLVVGTDCGGVKEVIGDAGILVPAQEPQRLAEGILKAFQLSEKEAVELGKKARERVVSHYSLKAMVDRWEEIYVGKY